MKFVFSESRSTIPLETWANLMDEPFTIFYNGKSNEFSNFRKGTRPLPGFKKLTVDQIVDICQHFRASLSEKQAKKMGMDLSFIGFVQQSDYEGVLGKVWALFARVFNWIVRGEFATSAERCKDLALDLFGLKSILISKEQRKEYKQTLKAYRREHKSSAEPNACLLNECLGRWLVSKASLNKIIKKVYQEEQLAG